MGNNVFANGREVTCKAADGKAICAFPDVCFTPPENPATPPGIPIPYPNTGLAKDTSAGSKSVKISKKEVLLKNKSYFKKSMGDEAGCAAKKGVITSTHRGKVYFNAWSMDVKFEGQNVVRHLDLTTHNHMSFPGNTPTWPYLDTMSMQDPTHPCVEDQIKEMTACKDYTPHGEKDPCPPSNKPKPPDFSDCAGDSDLSSDQIQQLKTNVSLPSMRATAGATLGESEITKLKNAYKESQKYKDFVSDTEKYFEKLSMDTASNDCLKARRCQLVPYKPDGGCCPDQTAHHLVEASAFHVSGRSGAKLDGVPKYDEKKAPCVCAEGGSGTGTHGLLHTFQTQAALTKESDGTYTPKEKTSLKEAQATGAKAVNDTFPESNCNPKCIEAQLNNYHEKECGINPETEIKPVAVFKEKATVEKRIAKAENLKKARSDFCNKIVAPSGKSGF